MALAVPDPKLAEHFLWDGLALLRRDDTIYVVEPHPSGGATVASHSLSQPANNTYYLNDLLGTTLAVVKNNEIEFNNLTSFGQLSRHAVVLAQPTIIQAPAPAAPISPPLQQLPPTSN